MKAHIILTSLDAHILHMLLRKFSQKKNGPILNIELFNLISKAVFDMRKHVGDKMPQTPGLYCENDRANHIFLEPPPLVIKVNTFSNKLVIQCIKISI
jgi:hypothetical protein